MKIFIEYKKEKNLNDKTKKAISDFWEFEKLRNSFQFKNNAFDISKTLNINRSFLKTFINSNSKTFVEDLTCCKCSKNIYFEIQTRIDFLRIAKSKDNLYCCKCG